MKNHDRPSTNPDIVKPGEFRELSPIEHWSASISLDGIAEDDFEAMIEESVNETGVNFLGFKIIEANQYVRTRYPRKKYNPPSVEVCRNSMDVLRQKLSSVSITEQAKLEEPRFRIVLGLIEGYGDENKTHTIEEVRTVLGSDYKISKAEIFSAHLYGGKYSTYREPAVIVEGDKLHIAKVYQLAEKFHQERFTVDDLEEFKSYTVETKHCTSPDNE